jgi:hypothetical protein
MPHSIISEPKHSFKNVKKEHYISSLAIIDNLRATLKEVNRKEHQSGIFNALLTAVSGSNISQRALARQLKVSRVAVAKVVFVS